MSASTDLMSDFVCSSIDRVHSMQKSGLEVKPLLIFGIWKHLSPPDMMHLQRVHFDFLAQICTFGLPVDIESKEGVFPLGLVIEKPFVLPS